MDERQWDHQRWDELAAGFGVLGRLHREAPDAQVLAALTGMAAQWPLAETAHAQRGLALLQASADSGEPASVIAADHSRLYGDAAAAVVPPYESVHRSREHLVFDRETMLARSAYRTLDLQAPHLGREPDDHIGLEFDFVSQALLLALEREDPARELRAATAFLHERLLPWAPAMLTTLEAAAATRFMASVAALSLGALESAREALPEAPPG